jgi:predicted esterase
MSNLVPVHITVPRTARYYMIGTPSAAVRDVWVVCHGYGQLAAEFAEPFRQFEHGERLIVVPEALSRFYLTVEPPHTPESPVGALWMTREDREAEIEDIVSYLDILVDRLFELLSVHGVGREMVRVHALGFSQGAPVVSRWAARGASRVGHLVLWGSGVPKDVNARSIVDRVGAVRVDLVYGKRDQFVTEDAVAAQEAVLAGGGVPYRIRAFDGGHRLNSGVLQELFEEG